MSKDDFDDSWLESDITDDLVISFSSIPSETKNNKRQRLSLLLEEMHLRKELEKYDNYLY